ncbi:glycosyltransferase family 4 protein [Roseateles sp. DAIF2]|uniref:glycosyltransferase family 4 protein n=1 Tax=Roseateles sp. DAIF2 TaxID=2714952 RepID=UPI0018A33721|nr:glycosyltransferase family 4 protein [Roseateles sp. DAIF2]QPF75096.1 glycosyltransferase family 4 protein [Roseateles sp. DAIF2]
MEKNNGGAAVIPAEARARKTVLFVHQGAELYGSDKVVLNLAVGVRAHGFQPIVVLPSEGPLLNCLRDAGVECHLAPIGKIARANLSPRGLLRLLGELAALYRRTKQLGLQRRVDLVYSNTIATAGGAVLAFLWRKPNVWHVHEIILRPRLVAGLFPKLVALGSNSVISNSKETAEWLNSQSPSLKHRNEVIWNGIGPTQAQPAGRVVFRERWGADAERLVVALVGRINRWKGHSVALAAVAALPEHIRRNVTLVYVGNVFPGQEDLERELRQQIEQSGIADQVLIQPFVNDVDALWEAVDIALVPSTEPEPFGMVAIEAMRAGKPVVASAHGGLLEIVKDGATGFLVPPSDPQALAAAIETLAANPELRRQFGDAGRERQREVFSLDAQVKATCHHLDLAMA